MFRACSWHLGIVPIFPSHHIVDLPDSLRTANRTLVSQVIYSMSQWVSVLAGTLQGVNVSRLVVAAPRLSNTSIA